MRILFVIDSMQRHLFFSRLARALKDEHRIFFASSEPLSIFLAWLGGGHGIHLSKSNMKNTVTSQKEIVEASEKCIEVLNNLFSPKEARLDIESIAQDLYAYIKKHQIERVVIWNGQQLMGRAATLAAQSAGAQVQYLELANLPGKLFSDPDGVNALSSIASNISIIDKLPCVTEIDHEVWLRRYELSKKKPLPQAQRKLKNTMLSVVNLVLKKLLNSTCTADISKRKISIIRPSAGSLQKNKAIITQGYIFLPLQVSSDTQIKLHSEYDNIKAIHFANTESKKSNVELVVKIHPAENDPAEIDRVFKEQENLGFHISDANTVELIKSAKTVITINSTVGMEALLYRKPVKTLGRCLYKEFDYVRLKKYIHHYLIDGVDYFESGAIPTELARNIIK